MEWRIATNGDIQIEAMPIAIHELTYTICFWFICYFDVQPTKPLDTIQLQVCRYKLKCIESKHHHFAVIDLIKSHSRLLCLRLLHFVCMSWFWWATIHTEFKIRISEHPISSVEKGWLNYALHWHPIKIKCRSSSDDFCVCAIEHLRLFIVQLSSNWMRSILVLR